MAHARYKHLVDALAADIRSGRLPPGTRLPTHRRLAADEGLAQAGRRAKRAPRDGGKP